MTWLINILILLAPVAIILLIYGCLKVASANDRINKREEK